MPVWSDTLSEQDRQVIARGGYGKKRGLGHAPALILIDCQYNHIGADKPILEQITEYPAGGGAAAWAVVRQLVTVREAARAVGIPVVYTRYCYSVRGARYDGFALKRGNLERFIDGAPGTRILAELSPADDELVVDKTTASALFGTPLVQYLVRLGVDSVLIGGVSTSGCVRATCIDAVSYGFNAAVLEDGVADRIEQSHKSSLLDLWMKYADVMTCREAVAYLQTVPSLRAAMTATARPRS
ncbi:MAG TPA: isochorismatase family protein [bacterium]|nr:isochorismatase family protein [bacterium]